jgi:large subunit ribosomal protein L23Ae
MSSKGKAPAAAKKVDTTKKAAAPKAARAKAAQKAALNGNFGTAKRRVFNTTRFRRPTTLSVARKPAYPRTSIPSRPRLDQYSILRYPLTTEAAMTKIEAHNTLVFIVDIHANKHQIKDAVKKMYDIKAVKVNTLIRPDGKKKAFVRLSPDHEAVDVANKIGII